VGRDNVCYIHVSLVPYIAASADLKTKPTQHSVKELRSIGIQPDFIVCRSDRPIDAGIRRKIALFCDVDPRAVISCEDAPSIYEVPLTLNEQGLDTMVIERLDLDCGELDIEEWRAFVERRRSLQRTVDIALVGKYVALPDAYLSVNEALDHAGIHHDHKVNVHWLDAEGLSPEEVEDRLADFDGILVPGGFGVRGIEGKVRAARWAREQQVPYLGICLGMQVAVVEFARHVAGLEDANSAEFDPVSPHPVIDLMRDQHGVADMGGTMRLGSYPCKVVPSTKGYEAYGDEVIYERHRHRFEVNNAYRQQLIDAGMRISGLSPDEKLVEMIELPDHPWFVGNQGHPEFKSRPTRPAPLFRDFIGAAVVYRAAKEA
jgi:CTP synthase